MGVWLAPVGQWLHAIPGCVFHCYSCPLSSFACPVGVAANYAAYANAAAVGDFKTSMLQDYEGGRRLELDAILGAVIELAERARVEVPLLRAILALVDLRARERPS